MTERLRDLSFNLCALCGGENVTPIGRDGKWYCDPCWPIVREARNTITFQSAFDQQARDYAGAQGGEYLEKIGTTDLALLTQDQWIKFLDTLFRAKQSELRRLYSPGAPLL